MRYVTLILLTHFVSMPCAHGAPPEQNSEKRVVVICFPTDKVIAGGCYGLSEKLKKDNWNLTLIDFGKNFDLDSASVVDNIRKSIPDDLPRTAPVIVHGHGQERWGDTHVVEYFRGENGHSLYLTSSAMLGAIRERAPQNPIWVSSCHSGCSDYKNDVCSGTSCLGREASYADHRNEKTLNIVGDLLTDENEFKKADSNHDEVLNSPELNLYFCGRFAVGKKRLIRLTTRTRNNDPFKSSYGETVYLPDKDSVEKHVESLEVRMHDVNTFSSVRTFKVRQYGIVGDGVAIKNSQLDRLLFESDEDAEVWAAKNLDGWPYYGSSTISQSLGISKIKCKRHLQQVLTSEPDVIAEVTLPDASTVCKIWDDGWAPNSISAGWQTPQFNRFKLYSPKYNPGKPHAAGDSAQEREKKSH